MPLTLTVPAVPATRDLSEAQWYRVACLYADFIMADYWLGLAEDAQGRIERRGERLRDERLLDSPARPAAVERQAADTLERMRCQRESRLCVERLSRNWAGMDRATRAYVDAVWRCGAGIDAEGMKRWVRRQLDTGGARHRDGLEPGF